MKGARRQTRRGNSFFFGTALKRTPGTFGPLTAEVEPGAAKQEGECFHVFMCVFLHYWDLYTVYMVAALSL